MSCSCGSKASFRRRSDKTVLSSIGHITVPRRYYACRECHATQTPWDRWAGLSGPHRLTPHARRLTVLGGSGWSFDRASAHLKEMCHVQVSDAVIRRVCDEEGRDIQQWMKQSEQPRQMFAKARGEVEFSTDGIKINTVDGWREMRPSVMSKRPAAAAAGAEQWDQRVLEEPTARVAWCQIAKCGCVGASWKRMAGQLGLEKGAKLSIIADGARWIWEQSAKRFAGMDATWVVDVYHLMLYLYAYAAAVFGSNVSAAKQWSRDQVVMLIRLGGPKFIQYLLELGNAVPAAQEQFERLLKYLKDNADSLWYGARLKEGLPIGSGLIEGACKNVIGARLKLNNARWRVRRAERMGAIRCLQYSDLWEAYWEQKMRKMAA